VWSTPAGVINRVRAELDRLAREQPLGLPAWLRKLVRSRLPTPTETWAMSGFPQRQNQTSALIFADRNFISTTSNSKSTLFAPLKHLQPGNAIVGAAEPPTKLAADILHHHHIRVNVGLVVHVELAGRELVQHGWALRDDGR